MTTGSRLNPSRGLDLPDSELNPIPSKHSKIEGLAIKALDLAVSLRNSYMLRRKVEFNPIPLLIVQCIKDERCVKARKVLERWFITLGVDQNESETIGENFLSATQQVDCEGVLFSSELGEMTPTHYAAIFGTEISLKEVCSKGEINKLVSYDNFTPLHYAVYHQNKRTVEWLLRNGADENMKDENEETPYQLALANGNQEIIDLFSLPIRPN
ncbi:MAG: hypothetical protein ChlgKO_04350 [Chlamydiales bacterium]